MLSAQVSASERISSLHGSHLGPHGSSSVLSGLAAGCARDPRRSGAGAGARASGANGASGASGSTGGCGRWTFAARCSRYGYDLYAWGYDTLIL